MWSITFICVNQLKILTCKHKATQVIKNRIPITGNGVFMNLDKVFWYKNMRRDSIVAVVVMAMVTWRENREELTKPHKWKTVLLQEKQVM